METNAVNIGVLDGLLSGQDGSAVETINPFGESKIVLVCEHASNRVPQSLNNLGLTAEQLDSHVAWDPGARRLAAGLSKALNAPLVAARFSRLVYDCNRPPVAQSSMPYETEHCLIPGNQNLSQEERASRADEIYEPFHQAISDAIEFKIKRGRLPILVTVHSFTPVFDGKRRVVEIGYLHGDDAALSKALEHYSSHASKYDVRLNQPYSPVDGVLHTIEKHLKDGVFPHVMIEVRNDLLANEKTFSDVLSLLSTSIPKAVSSLDAETSMLKVGNK